MNLDHAIAFITGHAESYPDRQPTLGTLLEEVAELARALEGKHEDHPSLELLQIASIAANMLRQYSVHDVLAAIAARNARKAAA